jgi:hypothetical protein
MSIGRVFERSFSTIAHNPVVVLGLALVIGAIPGLLVAYLFVTMGMGAPQAGVSSGLVAGLAVAMLLSMVVSLAIAAVVQGALTRATIAESEGHRASFGECLSIGLRFFLPLIAVGIVVGLGVVLGLILLIVPGVILALMWSVAAPAVVVEREGVFAALRRSAELTKGARWKILGLFLVVLVGYWLLSVVLGFIGLEDYVAPETGGFTASSMIGGMILGTLFNAAWGTIQPALYVELRRWKEGDSVEALRDVFA